MNSSIPDPEDIGKLFVGGLSASTTKESLHNYFSQFGEVVDSVVMKNNETGRSRGFGFITFKDPNCVIKTLQIKSHELDGKKIDPKECTPRSMQKTRKQTGKCKVFLGGLPPDITEDSIRNGMSRFGKVDQVVIMFDPETKKCRGFGFLSFELEESIDQACAERFVIISGKQIECKKAEPRMNPKRLTQTLDFPKNQNGFLTQSPYSQLAQIQQSNWNSPPNQAVYSLQGIPFPNYPNYNNTGMVPLNATSPGYTAVPYAQPFPTNFGTPVGGYNYTPVPNNAYTSPAFTNNSQIDVNGHSVAFTNGTEKSCGTSVTNYNYTTVPANTYTQPTFTTNTQTTDVNGHNVAFVNETEKSCGSNDYSQTSSSYGPAKTYIGGSAPDVTYSSQGAIPSSNYQRYHPYKV